MVVEQTQAPPVRVAVVGPCSAGKTTLVTALRSAGYDARHVAQEHSYVPHMWQRISKPDVLIFLDLDYDSFHARRPHLGGGPARLAEQQRRLAHARQHCDLYLDTSHLPPEEIQQQVLLFLRELTIPS
jgi:hypothetical protein